MFVAEEEGEQTLLRAGSSGPSASPGSPVSIPPRPRGNGDRMGSGSSLTPKVVVQNMNSQVTW